MKIYYKSDEEIAKMRTASALVCEVLDVLEEKCVPGMSTWDLELIARQELNKRGGRSAFLGYANPPYPAVLCTSVNSVVVHGIPKKNEILANGDIIAIDFGAFVNGFCGDSARTITVGTVSSEASKLVEVAKASLQKGIECCIEGNRLQDIGYAIQSCVESQGFSVVRNFVGHGIGRSMHEDPLVPNYGEPGLGLRLRSGLVLAIEPMVNQGSHEVEILDDGWTAVTCDGSLSAHFEHTVAITKKGPWVLSQT